MGRTEQVHQADEGAAHGRQLRNNHGGLPQISVRGGFHRRPFRLSARRKERKQAPLRRLKGCTDYKKAVQIIKDGGYATSLTYVEKLISIIERWNLTQYDAKDSGGEVIRWYRVRKSWADAKSQKGAYKILEQCEEVRESESGIHGV